MKQYSTPILENDVMILDDVILLSGTSGSHDMNNTRPNDHF